MLTLRNIQNEAKNYGIRLFFKELYISVMKAVDSLDDVSKKALMSSYNKQLAGYPTTQLLFCESESNTVRISLGNGTFPVDTDVSFGSHGTLGFDVAFDITADAKPKITFGFVYHHEESPSFHRHFVDNPDFIREIFGDGLVSYYCEPDDKIHVRKVNFTVFENWFLEEI